MSTKTKRRPQADKAKSRASEQYRKAIASALDPKDRAAFFGTKSTKRSQRTSV